MAVGETVGCESTFLARGWKLYAPRRGRAVPLKVGVKSWIKLLFWVLSDP